MANEVVKFYLGDGSVVGRICGIFDSRRLKIALDNWASYKSGIQVVCHVQPRLSDSFEADALFDSCLNSKPFIRNAYVRP